MIVRMYDHELRLFWNVLSLTFNEAGELKHFYGFRWKEDKQKEYIDLDVARGEFELQVTQ